jgi:glyoxylase-like metal-dependent hydrolase (beta-lactamase superfamily II)
MRLHAIQTGSVRIKSAQVKGHGRGLQRRLGVFADRQWTGWLPTYAWVIDHPEGVIVVDTGQGAHLLETGKSLHPYIRWEVAFRIDRGLVRPVDVFGLFIDVSYMPIGRNPGGQIRHRNLLEVEEPGPSRSANFIR